jgi:hypothetical protein
MSCSEFAEFYQKEPSRAESVMFSWAQGYMSGINERGSPRKNIAGMPLDKQKQSIRVFCDQRPLANVYDAVRDLYLQLPDR